MEELITPASTWALVRILGPAWLRAVGLVQGGGLGVIALAVAVEAASSPRADLWTRLSVEVPRSWALLAAPLSVAASALAVARLQRQGALLALGTLGAPRRVVGIAALAAGLLVGAIAQAVGVATFAASEVVRTVGGWMVRGVPILDVPGGALVAPPPDQTWSAVFAYVGAASLVGSATSRGGWTLVASAGVLVVDLARRGLATSAWLPAVLIMLVAATLHAHRGSRPGRYR